MDRGQAYTLEGTIAAIVVVIAALYGIQAVDTGPWSGSQERNPDQLETQAEDFLSVTAANHTTDTNNSLRKAVKCYSPNSERGKSVIDGGEIDDNSIHFEKQLNNAFDKQGINYNLFFSYWDSSSGRQQKNATSRDDDALASPPENAGSATYRLALYDNDTTFRGASCISTDIELGGSKSNDPYSDVDPDSVLYNVVEVRLVVW